MSTSKTAYNVKVNRPYIGTDKNGKPEEKSSWKKLGDAIDHGKGGGLDIYLYFQPLVVNGVIEKISIYPKDDKPGTITTNTGTSTQVGDVALDAMAKKVAEHMATLENA